MINVNLLPKNLQRRREPGYWRIIAVAFPVLVLAIVAGVQLAANQTRNRLTDEVRLLELRLESFQPDLAEQRELQQRQQQLSDLIDIANRVEEDLIDWSEEILVFTETLPLEGVFLNSISVRAASNTNPDVFEGASIFAEIDVSGEVATADLLTSYLRSLENSPLYNIRFGGTSYTGEVDDETGARIAEGPWSLNMTLGVLSGVRDGTN